MGPSTGTESRGSWSQESPMAQMEKEPREGRYVPTVTQDKDNLSEDEIQEAKSTMRHAH